MCGYIIYVENNESTDYVFIDVTRNNTRLRWCAKKNIAITKQVNDRHEPHRCVVVFVVLCQDSNCKPKDCIDLKCYRVSTGQDGPHTVYPIITSLPSVNVSCDQTVLGGGWTVWLRRCSQIDDTNFNRTWDEYKNGFGRQEGANSEFYLGNEIVHLLTHNYPSRNGEFRIDAISYNNNSYGLSTGGFRLDSEADKYRLRVGNERDNVNVLGTAILYLKDQPFTTGSTKCRSTYRGIHWWFKSCTYFYFVGPHSSPNPEFYRNIFLFDKTKRGVLLKRAQMLFRQYGDTRQCDNPCMNGATCEYVAASDTSHCKCPSTHCGAVCEKKNMCKNNDTCIYYAKTKIEVCQCKSGFTGGTCADVVTTTTTTTKTSGVTKLLPVIGGVIALLVLIGLAVVGFFLYWLKKKRTNEKMRKMAEKRRKDRIIKNRVIAVSLAVSLDSSFSADWSVGRPGMSGNQQRF